jgi:photosystem II stability/assembly factor-like uncharacterized protein
MPLISTIAQLLFLSTGCSEGPQVFDHKEGVKLNDSKPDDEDDDSGLPDGTDTIPMGECPEISGSPTLENGRWSPIGEPPGGWISRIATHPIDVDRIYAGSQLNGLYLSEDRGQTWEDISPPSSHIYSNIFINPTDSDNVVVSNDFGAVTYNAGDSWQSLEIAPFGEMDSQLLGLVWLNDEAYAILGLAGRVFKSSDGLDNFEEVSQIWQMNAVPADGGHLINESLYKSFDWMILADSGALYAMHTSDAVYKSTDGIGWEQVLNWAPSYNDSFIMNAMALQETDTGTEVWVGLLADGGGESHLAYSGDGGETWDRRYATFQEPILWIAVHQDTLLVVGESQIYQRLEDGFVPLGSIESPMSVSILTDGTIVAGQLPGISRSVDGGENWTDVSDAIIDTDQTSLLVHPQCPGLLFSGTQCEMGGYVSYDWGQSWEWISTFMHYVMNWVSNPSRPEEIWVATDRRAYKSVTYGELWTDMIPSDLGFHFHGLAIDPNEPDRVFLGSCGSGMWDDESGRIYRSEDGGFTWEESSDGIPENDSSIHAIHFVEDEPGTVLFGSYRGGDLTHTGSDSGIGIYRSTDDGYSWSQANALGALNVPYFAECNGSLWAASELGVLKSSDAGENWAVSHPAGIDEYLALDCYEDTVIAMDGQGNIVRTDDVGASWEEWTTGYECDCSPMSREADLEITADGKYVYATARNIGMFIREL